MNNQHLINELESKHDARVIQTKENSVPLFTLNVSYYPIHKTPMDILMKMMLKAFQKAPIKAPSVLANILLVEPLFIEDLTNKMMEAKLIEKQQEEPYQLTAKGLAQLEAGIFEERLELVSEEVYYSEIHKTILTGDIDKIFELEDLPEPIAYAQEQIDTIHETNVIEALQAMQEQSLELEEDAPPKAFITAIEAFEIGSIQDIPISIFVLQENGKNRLFARVFNHFTTEWDDTIAQFVTENERTSW